MFYLTEFKEFGYHKIIILSCVLATDKVFQLHSNILINNNTSFDTYYSYVEKELSNYNNLLYGYHNEVIVAYKVKVWNMNNHRNTQIKHTHNIYHSNIRSFSTSSILNRNWYTGLIKPISLYNKKDN